MELLLIDVAVYFNIYARTTRNTYLGKVKKV